MATGAVLNACWDLAARRAAKPLWQLLAEMSPEKIAALVDFRYLSEALTPDEAQGRRLEWIDHLHEHFAAPAMVTGGRYRAPRAPGASTEILPESLAEYTYRNETRAPGWSLNTSALLTICFSRKPTLLGRLRSAGAALTVVITATFDRCLSIQALARRWHAFVVLRPLGSETLRPGHPPWVTRQVASTQTLHPHLFVINCTQVRMHGQTPTSLLKPDERASTARLSLPCRYRERVPGAVAVS
jgi:hypothetical protein